MFSCTPTSHVTAAGPSRRQIGRSRGKSASAKKNPVYLKNPSNPRLKATIPTSQRRRERAGAAVRTRSSMRTATAWLITAEASSIPANFQFQKP